MVATMKSFRPSGCIGPDISVVNAMWASSILDSHRFRADSERILARYEHVGAEGAFFPDEEQLTKLGINVQSLATCLDTGSITAAQVEKLLADLVAGKIDAEQFDDNVALTLVPTNADVSHEDALTFAAHMPDVLEAARFHPDDLLERALHGSGLCSCHVEYQTA